MGFSDDFLMALGAWQNGWKENQVEKDRLASNLKVHCDKLESKYKVVNQLCYRKRFLHKGELEDILIKDCKDEGIVSWTTDRRFAERFKGLVKDDAITGAIFEHMPAAGEVVINISALWDSQEFIDAANDYEKREPENAMPLFHFKNLQGEVILNAMLKGSEITALTGIASPFDELCNRANIPESQRDELFSTLIKNGEYVEEPRYTAEGRAQKVISASILKMYERVSSLKNAHN